MLFFIKRSKACACKVDEGRSTYRGAYLREFQSAQNNHAKRTSWSFRKLLCLNRVLRTSSQLGVPQVQYYGDWSPLSMRNLYVTMWAKWAAIKKHRACEWWWDGILPDWAYVITPYIHFLRCKTWFTKVSRHSFQPWLDFVCRRSV